jgi:pimeloyl-ACP methyl ester carboxylesterase
MFMSMRRRDRWLRGMIVATALAVVAGVLAAAPATAGPNPSGPPVPVLTWGPCPAGSPGALNGFVCAKAEVPLDYSKPNGTPITLAVVKHAATDPTHRLGTLFVNPGGPGGTGTGQLPEWVAFFPATLQQRFDIVSWDPRGIGESTPVQCFDSGEAEDAFLSDSAFFPVGSAQQQQYIETWRQFGKQCKKRARTLMEHVSTAEVARDMDLLRQAVGDPTLTYLGLSYGTFLGATYGNLFPTKVRALALDGNLAPADWTANGDKNPPLGISLRIGSDHGAGQNLAALLNLCGEVSTARCAFSAGTPAATTAKFDALLKRLESGPIVIGTTTVTYASLLTDLTDGLDIVPAYTNPNDKNGDIQGWVGVAAALQGIWQAGDSPTALSSTPAAGPTKPKVPPTVAPYGGPEGPLSVICGDAPNPRKARAYVDLVDDVLRRDGPIGLNALWTDEECVDWPVSSPAAYKGPWGHPTRPILVIGNTMDPSTPYHGSVTMAKQLANARLLTIEGYGHTEFLNPSTCASNHIVAYLLDGNLPPNGTVCHQDSVPFP